MTENENSTTCGLPSWVGVVRNDTAAYFNDILVATVNVPCAIFAFLSNLTIIVTVIKKPSLQKPCNILLCSLAFTDCLTGVSAQPVFVAWRFFLQRAQRSCLHQVLIFDVYNISNRLVIGLSFVNILIISFDRYYAVNKPLIYRSTVTNKDTMIRVIVASIIWLLCRIVLKFLFPKSRVNYIVGAVIEVLLVVVPIVNYIRMLFAVRRHNSQLGDAVATQQMSMAFQREKKIALDMCIVAILLLSSFLSFASLEIVKMRHPRLLFYVSPWVFTVLFIPSSINPWIYVWRNENLRNAVKSMMTI